MTSAASIADAPGGGAAAGERLDLSIVVVNWNTRELLRDCLASVFENADAEVLVVDNGSDDGSVEMVEQEFPRVRLIRNAENRGFAAANNQAMRLARGRYVLLLNSDTLVLDDALRASVEYLDRHPEVGAFGCRVLNPDRTLQLTCFQYPSLVNLLLLSSGLYERAWPRFLGRYQMRAWRRDTERDVDVVTGCYLIVRRKITGEVGLLDESFFFFGEETDWCRRIHDAGWAVRFAPVGEIVHIGNASGRKLSFRRDLMLTESLVRLHRKHGGIAGAVAAYSILLVFNASRWGWWAVRSRLSWGEDVGKRRDHFRRVVLGFARAWPRSARMRDTHA